MYVHKVIEGINVHSVYNKRNFFILIMYIFLLSTTGLIVTLTFGISKLETIHTEGTYMHYSHRQWENFTFPEADEAKVIENEGRDVGKIQTLHFLKSPNRSMSENKTNLLAFQPGISLNDRQALLVLFQKFVAACMKYNVTFFLYGGTLLGSLRHHDIIPWDDDIDVMVNSSDRGQLRHALSGVSWDYHLDSPDQQRWKFFWTKPRTLLHKPFRWPYIDIFFFLENTTHIYDEIVEFRETFAYPKLQVFPLYLRPFARSLLPAPRQSTSVINRNYSPSLCSSLAYSHTLEAYISPDQRVTVPCTQLYGIYPFVHTVQKHGRIHEHLMKGNNIIETFIVPSDCN